MDAGTGPRAAQGAIRQVELLLDRGSVEAFANEGELSCTRDFQPAGEGLSMKAEGGDISIRSLVVHPLESMWSGNAGK